MHTYEDTETYVSLVRTMPNLSGWSLDVLLSEYANLSVLRRDAAAASAPELVEVEQDLAAVAAEVERRTSTTPAAGPIDLPTSTYVRRTVDRATDAARRPDQDSMIWDYCNVLSIITTLDARGHGAAVREAADELAREYELSTQAEVERSVSA